MAKKNVKKIGTKKTEKESQQKTGKALTRNVRTGRNLLPKKQTSKTKAVKKIAPKKKVKKSNLIKKELPKTAIAPLSKIKKKAVKKTISVKANKKAIKKPLKKAAKKAVKKIAAKPVLKKFNLTTDSKGRHKLNGKFISKEEFKRLSNAKDKKGTQKRLEDKFKYIETRGNVFSYSVNSVINNASYTDLKIVVIDFFGDKSETTSKTLATSFNSDVLANAWEAINEMRENEETVESPEFSPLVTERTQNTTNPKEKVNRVLIVDYSDKASVNGVSRSLFLTYLKALL